ncbi:MAG: stage II sporulation protein M [Sphingomonadaceae bacterium]
MSAEAVQTLKSFRDEREGDWVRLEAILDRVEKRSPKALSDDDLFALPVLYRATLSSLSVARATSLDRSMVAYLEALSLRAYLYLYGIERGMGARIARFFTQDWPGAIRALWAETLVALALLIAGAAAGWLLVASDASWYPAIVPEGMAQGRGPEASADFLKSILYDTDGREWLGTFAAYLFTHNAQVALLAFALGFAFGIPTLLLVIYNGAMLGALLQVYFAKGVGIDLAAWLSVHGTTELFAIVLAAAAGLRIGTRVAFPGAVSRMAAARTAGRTAATAMTGVVIMLMVAGLLEGFARQLVTDLGLRFAIGGAMLAVWLTYFYLLRPRHGA